jgi:hypothetical protein
VCPSTGFCLFQCAVGAGLSGAECAGGTYDDGDVMVAGAGVGYDEIAPSPLLGLWCASSTECFAADSEGHLYASIDPSSATAPWPDLYSTGPGPAGYDPVQTVACPVGASSCLALDYRGNLIDGPAPPTNTQIVAALRAFLRQPAEQLALHHLVHAGGYQEAFTAPSQGTLSIVWRVTRTRVAVAEATARFTASARRRIEIRLTRPGRRLLTNASRIDLTANARFASPFERAIERSESYRVGRT